MEPSDAAPQDTKHDLRSALLWVGSTTFVWQALSWVFTLVTARLLSPTDYGLIALAETLLPYLAIMTSCSIATWMVQARSIREREEKAAFGLTTIMGASVSVLTFLFAPLVASFYNNAELVQPLRLISICFVFDGMQIASKALMRREMRFKALSVLNLCIAVSRAALQLFLAYAGFGYMSLVVGILFRSIVESIAVQIMQPVARGFHFDRALLREIFSFGLPATGSAVCWVIFCTADNVVIGRLFGVEVLGFYAFAFYLADLPMSKMSTILRPVALSHYSRLRSSGDNVENEFLKILRGALLVVYPVLMGIAAVAPEGVPLLLGEKWRPMAPSLQVLCVVGMVRALTDNISTLLLASGQAGKDLGVNVFSALVLPILFYVMGSRYGLNGIYVTWLCFYPLASILSMLMLEAVSGIGPRTLARTIALPTVAALSIAAAARSMAELLHGESEATVLCAKIGAGTIVYAAFALSFGRSIVSSLFPAWRIRSTAAEAA